MQKIADREYKKQMKQLGTYYKYQLSNVGEVIDEHKNIVLKIISFELSHMMNINYKDALAHGVIRRMTQHIDHTFNMCSDKIKKYADEIQSDADLFGRLTAGYIARKVTPPWIEVNLNLKDKPRKVMDVPWMGLFDFYFKKLSDDIMNRITQGLLYEESITDILTRVRGLFPKPKIKSKEDDGGNYGFDSGGVGISGRDDNTLDDSFKINKTIFGKAPVMVSEGVYTLEDVELMHNRLYEANNWESRQYRSWFSDELKSQNKYLSSLEQSLGSMMTEGVNQGMIQIGDESLGIKDFIWKVDKPQKKCDECTSRHDLTMTQIKKQVKDKYKDQSPPLHPNCLIGTTNISAAGISKFYKRFFNGEVITISVEGKDDITITPNHPVLTDRGWVRAGKLTQGDNLVYSLSDRSIVNILDPNNNHVETAIENVLSSIEVSRQVVRMSVPVSTENFHGDGVIDTEVDIIDTNSFLPNKRDFSFFKLIKKELFCVWHSWRASLDTICSKYQIIPRPLFTSNSSLCLQSPFTSLFGGTSIGIIRHKLRNASNLKTKLVKFISNRRAMNTDTPSYINARLSSYISLVPIKNISISKFSGHVYNLQTQDGYYIANGLIVHNCYCEIIPKIKDEWSESVKQNSGFNFDDESGAIYKADKQEKSLGFKDMNWDEWLKMVKG
ncbi:MAG: hypothetical protein IPQ08_06155 [Chitinophagaceae bacterium]|nr:hypothetical protein [Chitinophagaceae bacterium]